MRLVLAGPPGSGKGTQASVLSAALNVPHISTGELFRRELAEQTPLGIESARHWSGGGYVPDELVLQLVAKRLAQPDALRGFVLDGFPRTVGQSVGLDRILQSDGGRVDAVICLNVPDETVLARARSRRVCSASGCGWTCNLDSRPPRNEGRCDRCGSALTRRTDDEESVVVRRQVEYRSRMQSVIDSYEARGLLIQVDGTGSVDEVTARIRRALGSTVASAPSRQRFSTR